MSWVAMRKFIEQLPDGLSAAERSVLIELRIRKGLNGTCWPSQGLIASDTGLEERTVRRVIDGLKHRGLLRIKPRGDDRRSNEYELRIPDTESSNSPKLPDTESSIAKRNRGHSSQNTGHRGLQIQGTESAERKKGKDKERSAASARFPDEPRSPAPERAHLTRQQIEEMQRDPVGFWAAHGSGEAPAPAITQHEGATGHER